MLKRIKEITQVGTFRESRNLAKNECDKFTLIYSLNTYGKTTLTDVFHSLNENDSSIINARKSIPSENAGNQKIDISFELEGKEQSILFQDSSWSTNIAENCFQIFDNDFISKNLITGSQITRDNKENFTDFILGEEGVKISEQIKYLNLKRRNYNSKLETNSPKDFDSFSSEEKEKYLNLQVQEDKDSLNDAKKSIENQIENLQQIDNILELNEPNSPTFEIDKNLDKELSLLNKTLSEEYQEIDETIQALINEHIKKNVDSNNKDGKYWIQQGHTKHVISNNCPFCGQGIKDVDLLKSYAKLFNKDYKLFDKNLQIALENCKDNISTQNISVIDEFKSLSIVLAKYKKYSSEIEAEIALEDLEEKERELLDLFEHEKKKIKDTANRKKKESYRAISTIAFSSEFLEKLTELKDLFNKIIEEKQIEIEKAIELKNQFSLFNKEDIEPEIEILKKSIKEIELKIQRQEDEKICQNYISTKNNIENVKTEIESLSIDLKAQQSEYLENYFHDINEIYEKLGSRNFKLGFDESKRGDKKVYELTISFHDKPLQIKEAVKVFSESDKRALGLAIFLTKIKSIDNKNDYIIILDDHIVSFDDNRISYSVKIINELLREFKQVIVLTHYRALVKKIGESGFEGNFIQICKGKDTNTFVKLEMSGFLNSDFEKGFDKIQGFIDGIHTESIVTECRILIEEYLKNRFLQQIRTNNIRSKPLKIFIQDLTKFNMISQSQESSLSDYIDQLNPDHHKFVFGDNPENIKNFASNLTEFLFSI